MSSKREVLKFRYPPAFTTAEGECYAALSEMGIGINVGAVIDHRGGRAVRFAFHNIVLIHNVACVKCKSLMIVDGVHLARLPDGQQVWVRDARDIIHAADTKWDESDTAA